MNDQLMFIIGMIGDYTWDGAVMVAFLTFGAKYDFTSWYVN